MNYRLIDQITGERCICSKMEIDGIDYYVSEKDYEIGSDYIDTNRIFYGVNGINKKIIAISKALKPWTPIVLGEVCRKGKKITEIYYR
jgi:hypothetical protein